MLLAEMGRSVWYHVQDFQRWKHLGKTLEQTHPRLWAGAAPDAGGPGLCRRGRTGGPVQDRRYGVPDGARRDLRHGRQPGEADGRRRDQRRGRDRRPHAGARRRGLQVRRPGRYRRVQEADRRRRNQDHPGDLVQRSNAGSCPAGGGRRHHPVLGTCEQPRHRQGRRLHLPHPDQRHPGWNRHREYPVGRRDPHAGNHDGVDRLRRGRQAHVGGPVREARRQGGGRGAVPAGGYRLQVAADKAVRGES